MARSVASSLVHAMVTPGGASSTPAAIFALLRDRYAPVQHHLADPPEPVLVGEDLSQAALLPPAPARRRENWRTLTII